MQYSISPLDGRYANDLIAINGIVSEFAFMKYRLEVEIKWFIFLFETLNLSSSPLDEECIEVLHDIINNFNDNDFLRIKDLEKVTKHDIKALEYYIKEQFTSNQILKKYQEYVHFACTSEDINNLSYALMLKDIKHNILVSEFDLLLTHILNLANKYRNVVMLAKTHGQFATPTTMGKEFYNIFYRLKRQISLLEQQQILGKINGAVGNYNAHLISYPELNWLKIGKDFVENCLDLSFNPYTTQIEPHDYMAELFDNLRRINVILLDFVRNIWGYIAFNYFNQKNNSDEVGSSTMPHKINPIDFENAEGNLGIANALIDHLSNKLPISRFQRDLSDSTAKRNIGVFFAHSILAYKAIIKGLNKLEINNITITYDLDNNWSILAEPIQMIMRKYNIINAYEILKTMSRGKELTRTTIHDFINTLNIPQCEKIKLLNLTPHTYMGLANQFPEN